MVMYSKENIRRLQHCIHRVLLREPRIYYDEGAQQCSVNRKTFSKYLKRGLQDNVLYLPQIRLNMYEERREYMYFLQSDNAHELYKYYQKQPNVVYLAYTLGKFDLLIQTSKPLEVLPSYTSLYGSRINYLFPETPYYSFETALDKMEALLDQSHQGSCIEFVYPKEPKLDGSEWGWKVFPYLKYNLRTNYTFIVKKLGISFGSFYKGFDYLLKVSTVLVPFYPFGFKQYSQHFLVFWTKYEKLVCDFFSLLPCHVSITKVNDALFVYACVQKGPEGRFFGLCHRMRESGIVDRLWMSVPLYYWIPDI